MDVLCAPHIAESHGNVHEQGVSEVARIIPDRKQDIKLQMVSYSYYGGDVRIMTCKSE